MSSKKILLSGIQPSGRLHIGNYFGAMKQFVDLQDTYDTNISIVNYHALTTVGDPQKLKEDTIGAVIDHLAIGLDPEKVALFMQSDVPQITELAWIFNTLITVPYLSRAVAYKDKVEQGIEASVGLFDYPVLMAADILITGAQVVPVGADQKQHVEIARDIAQKFNHKYGETFVLPEVLIQETVATVPGIDGRKMSKSYNNTIPLFASRDEITKQVMSIVTDSSGDRPEHVYAIHKLFKSEEELESLYKENEGNYKVIKEALIEDIDAFIAPLREKRAELDKNHDLVLDILKRGGEKARANAEKKMKDVREKIGIITSN
jgi:tryptophanyl-tRNA synthetase